MQRCPNWERQGGALITERETEAQGVEVTARMWQSQELNAGPLEHRVDLTSSGPCQPLEMAQHDKRKPTPAGMCPGP